MINLKNKLLKYKISFLKTYYKVTKQYYKSIYFKNKIIIDLDLREKIDRQIYFRNYYEDELIKKTIQIISKNSFDYFFDVGCNLGIYSLLVAKENKEIKILAYDIFEENIIRMNKMISKNKFENIQTFSYGLSDKNIVKQAFTDHMNSTVFRLNKLDGLKYKVSKNVTLKKLDDIYPDLKNQYIFFKVDIENHELFFIEGAKNIFSNNNIVVQIETNDEVVEQIDKKLKQLNFSLIKNINQNWDKYYSNFELKIN